MAPNPEKSRRPGPNPRPYAAPMWAAGHGGTCPIADHVMSSPGVLWASCRMLPLPADSLGDLLYGALNMRGLAMVDGERSNCPPPAMAVRGRTPEAERWVPKVCRVPDSEIKADRQPPPDRQARASRVRRFTIIMGGVGVPDWLCAIGDDLSRLGGVDCLGDFGKQMLQIPRHRFF